MKKIILFYLLPLLLWAEYIYTNALIDETSPYLKQHAHNPVNWYPWSKVVLDKAKKENKLIFLSIGYSTCHWCHVMEEESFTDDKIAKLLNENFVSIKVDREEYPQIDKKYQQLYMEVYGERGGWPLSVFLLPNMKVFFLGTYIPKEEGYGSKGLENLLTSFMDLQKQSQKLQKSIKNFSFVKDDASLKTNLSMKMMQSVITDIARQYDIKNGGFAKRPKFPEASKLDLLLDIDSLNGNQKAFFMAEHTLKKMAKGGIYDQIGGGFFRYTTDEAWEIPHFEKMLYTNAELITEYVKLYEITREKLYKKVVEETIAQMEKHYMQENVYFSASDADSDGEEGGYFIYEYIKIKSALKYKGWKMQEVEDALAYIGIEEDGNIDGDFSHTHITSDKVPVHINALKNYLKLVRNKRTYPFIDKKINTAWNAMMIKALFEASKIDKKYLHLAKKRLDALLVFMRPEKILYHQTLLGKVATQKALLEDYAFLIDALIAGYERSYDERYLLLAQKLSDEAVYKFYKKKHWYLSDDGIEVEADFDDRYYTSALSVMLENLVQMSALTEGLRYTVIVKDTIRHTGSVLETNPVSAPKLVHTFLRMNKGDIIIHATKKQLLLAQKEIDKISYPFILSKVQESDAYLACKTTMCFAHDKNITKLIEQIEEVLR